MKISQACIDRPVLATVMSLIIALFGLISMTRLANRELPDVDPPIVSITTVFPGAAPQVVETSVTDVLEDQVNGIAGVKHVTSQSREQVSSITLEFDLDVDLDRAANDTRDRVARARGRLPEEVEAPIVAKRDSDAWPVMWLSLSGDRQDRIELTTIAETRVLDRLAKLPGVANVMMGGERRYAMRLWIDNRVLGSYGLTIADVDAALRRENVDIPSGRVESRDMEFTVRSLGELRSAADFENLILGNFAGELVRVRDIARVEVGAESVRKIVRVNGVPSLGLGVVKQSKANTLDVADVVRAEVAQINSELPLGVSLNLGFDSSKFIKRSIEDVTRTIFEAAILVVLVIYIFLRSVRATLVPAVAIPVSVLGAFAFLHFAGFTINTLTLMGITLAIGLVVDDAIVVLENITRWVESGSPPLEAARRGMQEISFAVVSSTVSAVAVFLPLTFLTDTTGRLFREFAVTVAAALAVSGFVAVTLSPALCARLVRRGEEEHGVKGALARFFERLASRYAALLMIVMRRPAAYVALGGAWVALGLLIAFFGGIEEELMPRSDRGYAIVGTQAPEGSTIDYTDRYQQQAEKIIMETPEVQRVFSVVAMGWDGPGVVNKGRIWASLSDAEDRTRSQREIVVDIGGRLREIAGIQAWASEPSPMRGVGGAGVDLRIQGPDLVKLAAIGEALKRRVDATPGFGHSDLDIHLNKPQLEVAIDRERASDLGVSVRDIATTLQILLGGRDLSTFKLNGETYDVIAQLRVSERDDPRDLLDLFVRSNTGELIALSALVSLRETTAPRAIQHFDRLRSASFSVQLDTISQGEAIETVTAFAQELLPESGGYRTRLAGESEIFIESGNALAFAYGLAILIVYLVLAAQFESFVHPLTILVAVALSFTGALVTLSAVGWMNARGWVEVAGTLNIFSKIGLVMLVGLVTKNSILIVEFANQLRGRGYGLVDAAVEAAQTRFRPILMTALATMAGILPIALGQGAGGEARAPLGIAVVGGMFFSSGLTFVVVPAAYVVMDRLQQKLRGRPVELDPVAVAGGR